MSTDMMEDTNMEDDELASMTIEDIVLHGQENFFPSRWLKFGVENLSDYNKAKEPIPFRRRVFSSDLDGGPITGKDVELLIESDVFKKLDDNDAVSLCCVGIVQLVLLGVEDRRVVPKWILRLANDRVGWDNYPWGSYGQLPVERLVPDEIEARSRWWVSSRAYFDGRSFEDEQIPRHLNRNNYFEVPSEMYREFEEQRRGYQEMKENNNNIDFHNNESNHQNESHLEKPKCSFAFGDYNEYEDEKNEFDDVVDDNPQTNYQKWQKYISFKLDIPETPLYKSKPLISKDYQKETDVKVGQIFDNKEALDLAIRLKALDEGYQFLNDRSAPERHAAIALAVQNEFPLAYHDACCRHLMMNLSLKRDKTKALFWKICKAYTIEEFSSSMSHLQDI
ncbi:hypothetical protein Tco_0837592 [Tanacetum coccineum]